MNSIIFSAPKEYIKHDNQMTEQPIIPAEISIFLITGVPIEKIPPCSGEMHEGGLHLSKGTVTVVEVTHA